MMHTILTETRSNESQQGQGAAFRAGRSQLTRLLQLILAIQSDGSYNARRLAELCEVSRRTIYRDLDMLEAAGVPIRYRSDRQGYQLAKNFFLPPLNLEEKEALSLAILSRQWHGGDGFGLVREARAGVVKLVQGLPAEIRGRVLSGSEPFGLDPATSEPLNERRAVYDAILDSLAHRLQLRIWYQDPERDALESTKVSPYRLLLVHCAWSLVGRSTLHRDVRIFRIPRIQRAQVTDDPYTIPPRFRLERLLGHAWAVEPGPVRHAIELRFSARVALEIQDTFWHHSQRLITQNDGTIHLHLSVDGLDEIIGWVLSYGDQVEIVAPAELRQRVAEVAQRVIHACTSRQAGAIAAANPGNGDDART